jgi:protein gp37
LPPMHIRNILWGRNTSYATRRATIDEIEDVLRAANSSFRRNTKGRVATHKAVGRTADGRPLAVLFIYAAETRSATPINAWEER